ncbi:MAG: response regulator [Chloroflexi bacterium]|nr:response regulator [Chloroflexota bacterium]
MRTDNYANKGRILIVDDTPHNIEVLYDILSPDGYELSSAADGETGLQRARADKPDLVLLDLVLPGMMGIEVLEVLKQEQPQTTVILTTAYGSEETAIQAMRRGVNDYIINKRPFDPGEVREVVRSAIAESRLRQENFRLTHELELVNQQLQEYAGHLERNIDELRSANERLKELDRMKASFFSMISHELRHPLTVAKGYLELIETGSGGEVTTEMRRYLRIINDNFDHLAEMIDDLLDLSRMEAGRYHITRQAVRPSGIINHTIQAFAASAKEKEIQLETELPDSLPLVSADPLRVVQVLTNLLQNAIKFTPSGGSITVSACESGPEVQFCVADTGIGIPPAELERIFDRFYQVRRDDSNLGGAGLGLAISKEIIRLHGGRIWAESVEGKGSRFYFALPRAVEEQSP